MYYLYIKYAHAFYNTCVILCYTQIRFDCLLSNRFLFIINQINWRAYLKQNNNSDILIHILIVFLRKNTSAK